jgi:hypothetical protein
MGWHNFHGYAVEKHTCHWGAVEVGQSTAPGRTVCDPLVPFVRNQLQDGLQAVEAFHRRRAAGIWAIVLVALNRCLCGCAGTGSMQRLVDEGLNPSRDVYITRARAVILAKSGSLTAAKALVTAYGAFHTSHGVQSARATNTRRDALEAGIEKLPLQVLVKTIVQEARSIVDFDELHALIELLMPSSPLDSELRLSLPEDQRESVRSLVFRLDGLPNAYFVIKTPAETGGIFQMIDDCKVVQEVPEHCRASSLCQEGSSECAGSGGLRARIPAESCSRTIRKNGRLEPVLNFC